MCIRDRPLRHRIFTQYHNLAHPGVRRTRKLISTRYMWPLMNKDIGEWTRQCLNCQQSKITKHTRAPLSHFSSSKRLEHVHIHIIGRLPTSDGFNYCLTMIDRGTHWMEIAPMPVMTADTVVNAFISTWVARYGCPALVTTDQGRQFQSQLFHELSKALGTNRIRTCAYHPQSNGLIENLHRTLKAAIMCTPDPKSWAQQLPFLLLAFRNLIISDTDVTPAEALYGQVLRLPGDMFDTNPPHTSSEISKRISEATSVINKLRSHDTQHRSYIPRDLQTCSHAWVRVDRIKPTFTHPYTGPFKILKRQNKHYTLSIKNKPVTISIDRLKPYIQPPLLSSGDSIPLFSSGTIVPAVEVHDSSTKKNNTSPVTPTKTYTTRSGRQIKPVVRFAPDTK